MLKVVLDANLFVSATLTEKGHPASIIDAWREGKFELIISTSILKEIRRVVFYPKVRKASPWTDEEVENLLKDIEKSGIKTPENIKLEIVEKDPTDDKYITAAVEGKAAYIITGDRHLLDLRVYKEIEIIRPAEFLRILERHSP